MNVPIRYGICKSGEAVYCACIMGITPNGLYISQQYFVDFKKRTDKLLQDAIKEIDEAYCGNMEYSRACILIDKIKEKLEDD